MLLLHSEMLSARLRWQRRSRRPHHLHHLGRGGLLQHPGSPAGRPQVVQPQPGDADGRGRRRRLLGDGAGAARGKTLGEVGAADADPGYHRGHGGGVGHGAADGAAAGAPVAAFAAGLGDRGGGGRGAHAGRQQPMLLLLLLLELMVVVPQSAVVQRLVRVGVRAGEAGGVLESGAAVGLAGRHRRRPPGHSRPAGAGAQAGRIEGG